MDANVMIAQEQLSESMKVFFASFAVCLSVALINGYPLLFDDSYGYLGFDPWIGQSAYRPITLDFLARPFYPVFGVWSVILIQITILSYLISLFSAQYLTGGRILELSALIIFSQLPFFAGFVMADVWFVIFVLAFLCVIKTFRGPPFLILAFAITVHGSHLYLFIISIILALLIFEERLKIIKVSIASILLAIIFTTLVDGLMDNDRNRELSWELLGSKILVQIPDAIENKCTDDPSFLMCSHRGNIQEGVSDWCDEPDCFLWKEQSFFHTIDKGELRTASKELFTYTLLSTPLAFTKTTIRDFLNLFKVACSDDFGALAEAESGMEPAITGAPINYDKAVEGNAEYARTLQAAGLWGDESPACLMLKSFKLITYFLGAIGLLMLSLFFRSQEALKVGVFCVIVLLANDLLFAAVSGGEYLRYHDRGLFLLVIPALLAISELRKPGELNSSLHATINRLKKSLRLM